MMGKGKGATKKARRTEERRQKAEQKKWKIVLAIVAAAVMATGGGWFYARRAELPGQEFADMGRRHIPPGTPAPAYNSSPPTSGPHANEARWGEHGEEIPEINQVHNLEHGGILIQYNCTRLPAGQGCDVLRSGLRAAFQKARREIDRKIVLAPYAKMRRTIALTAWTRLQYLDAPDEAAILRFAEAHIDNGPERVP
jgi:hypothetical protein